MPFSSTVPRIKGHSNRKLEVNGNDESHVQRPESRVESRGGVRVRDWVRVAGFCISILHSSPPTVFSCGIPSTVSEYCLPQPNTVQNSALHSELLIERWRALYDLPLFTLCKSIIGITADGISAYWDNGIKAERDKGTWQRGIRSNGRMAFERFAANNSCFLFGTRWNSASVHLLQGRDNFRGTQGESKWSQSCSCSWSLFSLLPKP